MRKGVQSGVDARTCKQANLRLFNESLNRLMKDLPNWDLTKLFTVEFRGYKFNALPFILSGACYFDNVCYGWLLKAVAQDCPIKKDVNLQDIYKNRLINGRVMEALLPGSRGRRELWAFYFDRNPSGCTKLLYQSAVRALNRIILRYEYQHINYQYREICNTQAFCYYMTIYWLVNITPVLRRQIDPNLRKADFMSVIESTCPEESIHFKYIKGEITVDQLVRQYDFIKLEDDSTIGVREAYSNMSKGNYDGSPMTKEQWSIGREECDSRFQGAENYLNMHLAHAYLYSGTYDRLTRELDSAKSAQKASLESEERQKKRYSKASDECRRLRKQNKELQEQVSQLKLEISRHDSHDELHKRIAELEKNLSSSLAECDKLFDERLELKQELSRSAKQIKKLSALVPDREAEESNAGVANEDVSTEVMVEALKDKRIVMVGGDRSKTVVKTFEDWGFRYFSNISGNVRRIECDFVVICSILCSHTDMYQAERMMRGQDAELVYVNGVNAELILKALYEALEG